MNTISSAPAALRLGSGSPAQAEWVPTLKRWCVAYIMWRIEQAE